MIPPSALEAVLALAFEEPVARSGFCKALLDGEVLTLVTEPPKASGRMTRPAIVSWLRNDGEQVIPVFTSPQALCESGVKEPVVVVVPTRTLLEAIPGHAVHINPGSSHNCQLSVGDAYRSLVRQAAGPSHPDQSTVCRHGELPDPKDPRT